MRGKGILALLVFMLATVRLVAADTPGPGNDPIGQALIPPDLIMAHQDELGLTNDQRQAIQTEVQQAQQHFTALQWQLSASVERLAEMLRQPHVDEKAALAQLDREQTFEREIKRTQFLMMIQVKNELTPSQQVKAYALKRSGS